MVGTLEIGIEQSSFRDLMTKEWQRHASTHSSCSRLLVEADCRGRLPGCWQAALQWERQLAVVEIAENFKRLSVLVTVVKTIFGDEFANQWSLILNEVDGDSGDFSSMICWCGNRNSLIATSPRRMTRCSVFCSCKAGRKWSQLTGCSRKGQRLGIS